MYSVNGQIPAARNVIDAFSKRFRSLLGGIIKHPQPIKHFDFDQICVTPKYGVTKESLETQYQRFVQVLSSIPKPTKCSENDFKSPLYLQLQSALEEPSPSTIESLISILEKKQGLSLSSNHLYLIINRLIRYNHLEHAQYVIDLYENRFKLPKNRVLFVEKVWLTHCLNDLKAYKQAVHEFFPAYMIHQSPYLNMHQSVYGAIVYNAVRLGLLEIAEIYFRAAINANKVDYKLINSMLIICTIQKDWERGFALMQYALELMRRGEKDFDGWSMYYYILFCERCDQNRLAMQIRNLCRSPLIGPSRLLRPFREKPNKAKFLPYTSQQVMVIEDPFHNKFKKKSLALLKTLDHDFLDDLSRRKDLRYAAQTVFNRCTPSRKYKHQDIFYEELGR